MKEYQLSFSPVAGCSGCFDWIQCYYLLLRAVTCGPITMENPQIYLAISI